MSRSSEDIGARSTISSKGGAVSGATPSSARWQSSGHEQASTVPGVVPENITTQQARDLLSHFRQLTVDQMPIIQLNDHDTLETLATVKPTLALAILTAASSAGRPSLFKQLYSELTRRLARKAVIDGERNIELVQAILVMETWLWVPDSFENINFYQWIHIAATMALQLGLGGDPRSESRTNNAGCDPAADMEEIRTMLVVYLSASSVAISLRRDNIFGLTPAIRVALDTFSKQAETANDRRLLAWVRLEMIADDIQSVTPYQHHSRESILAMSSDIAANVYRLHVRLESWKQELQPGIMNEMLFVHFQYCKAKLYEIPVHFHHDLSKLVAYPFTGGAAQFEEGTSDGIEGNAILLRAMQPYRGACRGVLHAVLAILPEVLGRCPTVLFARAVYAMNGLRISQKHATPTEDMRAIHDLMARHLEEAIGDQERQVPKAFLNVWNGLLENEGNAKQTIVSSKGPSFSTTPADGRELSHDMPSGSSNNPTSPYNSPQTRHIIDILPLGPVATPVPVAISYSNDADSTLQLFESTGTFNEMLLDPPKPFSDSWFMEYDPALDDFVASLEAGDLSKCPWQQWRDAIDIGQNSSID